MGNRENRKPCGDTWRGTDEQDKTGQAGDADLQRSGDGTGTLDTGRPGLQQSSAPHSPCGPSTRRPVLGAPGFRAQKQSAVSPSCAVCHVSSPSPGRIHPMRWRREGRSQGAHPALGLPGADPPPPKDIFNVPAPGRAVGTGRRRAGQGRRRGAQNSSVGGGRGGRFSERRMCATPSHAAWVPVRGPPREAGAGGGGPLARGPHGPLGRSRVRARTRLARRPGSSATRDGPCTRAFAGVVSWSHAPRGHTSASQFQITMVGSVRVSRGPAILGEAASPVCGGGAP